MNKITVLMPIYNGIEFIKQSVESVKAQTYTHWELIIGVNGHEENSKIYKIAKEYENNNIKVYDLFRIKGKSNALNKMLEYSTAEWIALLDVDDIWLPKKLEMQKEYMNNYDVIGTKCKYFGEKDIVPEIPIGDISDYNFLSVNPIINSSCLIKKKICNWNEIWNGVEDYDLWLKLRSQNKKFYNIDSIKVMHRIHKESAFNAKGNNLKAAKLKELFS